MDADLNGVCRRVIIEKNAGRRAHAHHQNAGAGQRLHLLELSGGGPGGLAGAGGAARAHFLFIT